jgi:hypothetical protein
VAIGFLRCSDSRGSINRSRQANACVKNTRVSLGTLCPLGQSKKAIDHESQIGPCVATHQVDNCLGLFVSENQWRSHNREMEPQGEKCFAASRDETNRTPEQDHSQITGARPTTWAECREKSISAPSRGEGVSLDIPLYRTASGQFLRPAASRLLLSRFLPNSAVPSQNAAARLGSSSHSLLGAPGKWGRNGETNHVSIS